MNIINIDYEKGTVQSDFFVWEIISNNNNKFLFSDEIDLSIEDLIKAYKNWLKKYMVN